MKWLTSLFDLIQKGVDIYTEVNRAVYESRINKAYTEGGILLTKILSYSTIFSGVIVVFFTLGALLYPQGYTTRYFCIFAGGLGLAIILLLRVVSYVISGPSEDIDKMLSRRSVFSLFQLGSILLVIAAILLISNSLPEDLKLKAFSGALLFWGLCSSVVFTIIIGIYEWTERKIVEQVLA